MSAAVQFRKKQGEAVAPRTSVPRTEVEVALLALAQQRRQADVLEGILDVLREICDKL